MTGNEQIREALKGFVNKSSAITLIATVKSVDEVNSVITVNLGDTLNEVLIEDVRLRSTIDGDFGFCIIPKVGSVVLLLRLGAADDFLAVAFSEFDKAIFKGQSASLEVNQSEIVFNDNVLGGFMPDITKLISKINALETQVNNLKTVFSTWVTVPNDGGAALKTASATWAGTQMAATTVNDIKDPKIKN